MTAFSMNAAVKLNEEADMRRFVTNVNKQAVPVFGLICLFLLLFLLFVILGH